MNQKENLYGLIAEFETPDGVVEAAHRTQEAGYRNYDAYSPFPMHELFEAMEQHRTWVSPIVLIGGLTGLTFGFLLQTWTAVFDYPLNIGGRPTFSWPSFIPITFESMVLLAAFSAVIGMLALNGLPKPYHPVFNAPGFERASSDRFFLCIEATDPKFNLNDTTTFLQGLGAINVAEVEE
jgi:hypothetical protein